MIYCNLQGGLGNILFQIATGYSLAEDLNTQLEVVIPPHHFSHGDVYTKYKDNILKKIRFTSQNSHSIYREPSFSYNPLPQIKGLTLEGYFQSELYFGHNRSKILNLFSPLSTDLEYIKSKYQSYLDNPLISLHVRRGDYLKFPEVHPTCSIEYYKNALSKFPSKLKVLIFSDDVDWCKQNFLGDRFIFIQEKDYISLYLMSLCTYNIIANSSFSWWGAWLNQFPDKVVIAPKQWFGSKASHDPKDLIPKTWITL
jgi:hypothetical protein